MAAYLEKYGGYLIAVLLLLLQLPFLEADADALLSFSRGIYTDEGLYTAQIRDYVDNGILNVGLYDALVKTPLFSAFLFPVFKLFGTDLLVGRLFVLLFSIGGLVAWFKFKKLKAVAILFLLLGSTQYHLFHFMHLCLAESLCIAMIIMALFTITVRQDNKGIFLASLFMALAYYTKIQFVYVLPILPSVLFGLAIQQLFKAKQMQWKAFKPFIWTLFWALLLLGLYILVWYLPNKTLLEFVLSTQQEERLVLDFQTIVEQIKKHYNHIFFTDFIKHYRFAFWLSLPLSVWLFIKNDITKNVLLIGAFVWLLLELPKLSMVYLPTRYLLSLYAAGILWLCIVLSQLYAYYPKLKWGVYSLVGLFLWYNSTFYQAALDRRTYHLKDINTYLAEHLNKQDVSLGAWSASLNWQGNQRAIPVWDKYFNYERPLERFKPRVVIVESEEVWEGKVFNNPRTRIFQHKDSSSQVQVGTFPLYIYWISE